MARSKPKYRDAPDGLPAREVGPWVERKVHYVDRHATIFATGMSKKWRHRAYVELFAGPGTSFDKGRREFIAGSAMRALDREFTHYAYVDLDKRAADALRERIRRVGMQAVAPVFHRDCNAAVDEVRSAVPKDALTLAFIDPTNWQVKLSTIASLVEKRHVDLLMTFHAGSMKRMRLASGRDLDEFFGTGEWRDVLRGPSWERTDGLLALYNRKLGEFGYLPSWTYRVPVKVPRKNITIYELVVFSRNPRGVDFWQKAIGGPDETGGSGFWDPIDLGR